ncbi:hypothetical protein [Evansella cellulosilytica]|uniref:Uncharacterized protein n=1 Tax=Evansella cellulosilytica (strain ATCC 21833 / DSM 2522 / FERM P-1141 / JCM 9156 / N-4) TaxID=649639 RepID=E6TR34_EVAC2|nr:hypothetical protein [Evansella cellulosilytica]ADU29410.1 hypothetical protein Bcell_1142 [Evansella cellulosilytica DSM 2522]
MWIAVVTGVIFIIIKQFEEYNRNRPKTGMAEIGDEKIEGGYLWWNVGDQYDNEHWLILDYVGPNYYITITEIGENGSIPLKFKDVADYHPSGYPEIHLKINNEPSDNPEYHVECDGERGVELEIDFLMGFYRNLGKVVVDQRYKELMELHEQKTRRMKELKKELES